MIAQY